MILQPKLSNLETEIAQLQALIEAKRQQQEQLVQLDRQTGDALALIKVCLEDLGKAAPDAIAFLKSAVLGLFGTDGDGTDGGNQPTDPSPLPSEPTFNLQPSNFPTDPDDFEEVNFIDEDCLEYPTLSGQTCQINKELELYWERNALPSGQAWEFASPLACLLEDCPVSSLTGQAYQLCSLLEDKPADIPQPTPSTTELVHTSARTGYLKIRGNGQILAGYAWFSRKDLAEAWFEHFDMMSIGSPELRLSQRNSSFKYELKLTGLNMRQIDCLTKEELHKKPTKAKTKETPAQEYVTNTTAHMGSADFNLPRSVPSF